MKTKYYADFMKLSMFRSVSWYSTEHSFVSSVLNKLREIDNVARCKKGKVQLFDKYEKDDLDCRQYNAMARVLSLQEPCTAVSLDKDNTLYVSYNASYGTKHMGRDVPKEENQLLLRNMIDNFLSVRNLFDDSDHVYNVNLLLCAVLKHSTAYGYKWSMMLQMTNKPVRTKDTPQSIDEKIKDFFNKHIVKYKATLDSAGIAQDFAAVQYDALMVSEYYEMLADLQNMNFDNVRYYYMQELLSILGDVLVSYSKLYNVKDIKILNNDNKLHCEVNISESITPVENSTLKIGISKTCCFLCEIITGARDIVHSGAHGLLYYYDARSIFNNDNIAAEKLVHAIFSMYGLQHQIQAERIKALERCENIDDTEVNEMIKKQNLPSGRPRVYLSAECLQKASTRCSQRDTRLQRLILMISVH